MEFTALFLVFLAVTASAQAVKKVDLARLKVPPGFTISLYFNGTVKNPRGLTVSTSSFERRAPIITYVGSRDEGNVYALVDRNRDGVAEARVVLMRGITTPTGVAFRNGSLYVSGWDEEVRGCIWRYDGVDEAALANRTLNKPSATITAALPGDGWHGLRFMRFGPDGLLYINIGAPCNVCNQSTFTAEAPGSPTIPYGSIITLDVVSRRIRTFARGIRNSVGFDWHPTRKDATGAPLLFFTDNGRDGIGDNQPDDELNAAWQGPGSFFGFPYCHTLGEGDPYRRKAGVVKALPDPEYNLKEVVMNCSDSEAYVRAIQPMGPHVAALGMRFYAGDTFPPIYRGAIFIAQRGSWDRSVPIGYRITVARLDPATMRVTEFAPFATGWLQEKPTVSSEAWGRPADVQPLPDGSLLISDDTGDSVYRVAYSGRR